jgi:hypothetical protein
VRFKEIYQHSDGYNEQHKNRRNATASALCVAGLMVLGEFVLRPFVASALIDLPGDNSTWQSLMKLKRFSRMPNNYYSSSIAH